MPLVYQADMDRIIVKPEMKFLEICDNPNESLLINELNKFITFFLFRLSPSTLNSSEKCPNVALNGNLKGFVSNILREANIQRDQKRFTIACFLQALFTSVEIMKILGLTKTAAYLRDLVESELKKPSALWTTDEKDRMSQFARDLQHLSGSSSRLSKLFELLNETQAVDDKSRIIVFVRTRKTPRLLFKCLCEDDTIRRLWRPKDFVGHVNGSADGMTWADDQEPRLDKFTQWRSVKFFLG
jgi:ERCC4-related helicase